MSRQDAFCERQDDLYVEFVNGVGVAVDLCERQLFAQLVALPAIAGEVDRLGAQECFVEPVELLLDRSYAALLLRRPLARFRPPLLPHMEDAILHQAHVAGRRLQKRQFVNKRAFEHGFADIYGAALPLTVVKRGEPEQIEKQDVLPARRVVTSYVDATGVQAERLLWFVKVQFHRSRYLEDRPLGRRQPIANMTGNDDESTIVNGSPGAAGMKGESDARGTAATVDANSAESAARFYAKSCVVSFFLGLSTVMLISSGCSFFVTVSLVS